MFTKKGPNYNEKVERNRKLYRYRCAHPEMTFKEIGAKFDMSAAAAHKIYQRVKKEGGSQTEEKVV